MSDFTNDSSRKYDIVIYGATGYTGRLACVYLASHPNIEISRTLKWAVAGRSRAKLENIIAELHQLNPRLVESNSPTILIADCDVADELDLITSQARCLLNFVGPYSKYGSEVVSSCVRNACHYVDLTGELAWVRRMINCHDQTAIANQTRVITVCGFDSVPSDLAMLIAAERIHQWGMLVDSAEGVFLDYIVSPSGGTLSSMQEMYTPDYAKDSAAMKMDPQYFNPENIRNGLDVADLQYPKWLDEFNSWISPFIMSPLNSRVVRRSNAICNYGPSFRYNEGQLSGNYMFAKGSAVVNNTVSAAIGYSAVRSLVQRFGPQPGQGPDPRGFDRAYFKFKLIAKAEGQTSRRVIVNVNGHGDPGYQLTARMMIEAGICLVKFPEKLPPSRFGFQTPASGIGSVLSERLSAHSSVVFTVEETEEKSP